MAVVLVTHREEEVEALGFPNVLRLKKGEASVGSRESKDRIGLTPRFA